MAVRDGARRDPAPPAPPARWAWCLLAAALVFAAVVRIRFLDLPLERDEGEYAYAGQLILQGIPPYHLVYNMKFPGIYYAYALILALFGQTQASVHLGLLLVNSATIALVFLLGRRLLGCAAGGVAAAAYAVLSASPSVAGLYAHATHFVVLPALGGLLLLHLALDDGRHRLLFWSGVLLGTSVLMKQHGAFFLAFAALLVTWTRVRDRAGPRRVGAELAVLVAGAAAPIAVACAALLAGGAFGRFRLWAFGYAWDYVSQRPWSDGPAAVVKGVRAAAETSHPLWILALVGFGVLLGDLSRRRSLTFASGFFAFSFLATVPGLYFRPHYFILALPAVAILAAAVAPAGAGLLRRWGAGAASRVVPAALVAAALAGSIALDGRRLFGMTPTELSRSVYFENPFPEALAVGKYLEARASPEDTIVVMGSEPEIFFYAARRSATGYVYTYPLMETHGRASAMRDEMLREIEAARPKFAVFVAIPSSWVDHQPADTTLLDRLTEYCDAHYDRVGILDLVSSARTEVRWDDEVAGYVPKSRFKVWVLIRRADSRAP